MFRAVNHIAGVATLHGFTINSERQFGLLVEAGHCALVNLFGTGPGKFETIEHPVKVRPAL
jgi:hypothetical protein